MSPLNAQVAERSIAMDCKSIDLWSTKVRILPCALLRSPLKGGELRSAGTPQTNYYLKKISEVVLRSFSVGGPGLLSFVDVPLRIHTEMLRRFLLCRVVR